MGHADGRRCAARIAGPDLVTLHTPAPIHGEDLKTVADFEVASGETMSFVLTHGSSHVAPPEAIDPEAALKATEEFWTEWASRNKSRGEWDEAVMRSLITLKALTYAPTGGLVAAPTTSLPEQLGGKRNWDYRYCWLRDATLTLLAMMNAGYYDEARDWRDWLLRAAAGAPAQLQIMYGLAGERRLPEIEIPWLPGYENSTPVRVGNAAHDQLQLDVYGEVMDAMHQARRGGLVESEADWAFQSAVLRHLESIWQRPDHGLWEVRGEPRHFTYSKVMAWVAFDRGIHAIEQFNLSGPVDRWRQIRQAIHDEVCERGFDRELGSFVQSDGSKELDASLLLLSTVGFLPPDDPRIRGTIEAVERRLFSDGFLLRYDTRTTDDGLPEGRELSGVQLLAGRCLRAGRTSRRGALALQAADRARKRRGTAGRGVRHASRANGGQFPTGVSHVALVNTTHNLLRATKPAEQRAAS